jgi:hypothetical protein
MVFIADSQLPNAPETLGHPDKSYAEAAAKHPNHVLEIPPLSQSNSNAAAAKSPGEYEGAGILEAPTSPRHKRLSSRSSRSSMRANGLNKAPSREDNNLVYQKYQDGEGGHLTSVKPPEDYEQDLALDEKERKSPHASTKREQELGLESGRVAAAGWERSGYVCLLSVLLTAF